MNSCRALALSLVFLASAGFATASSAQGLTRVEARADLARVEQAGYTPSAGEDANYPNDLLVAEAKVATNEQQQPQQANEAMGGAPMGTSAASTQARQPKPAPDSCVGPASFCNIFFGS